MRSTVEALQRSREKLIPQTPKSQANTYAVVVPGVRVSSGLNRIDALEAYEVAQTENPLCGVYLYENTKLIAFEEPEFIRERLAESERRFKSLRYFDYDVVVYSQLRESDGFNLYEFYGDVVKECARKGYPVVSLTETINILEKFHFAVVGDMPSTFSVVLKEEDYKIVSEEGEETVTGFNDEDARKKAKEKMGDKKFSVFNKNNEEILVSEGAIKEALKLDWKKETETENSVTYTARGGGYDNNTVTVNRQHKRYKITLQQGPLNPNTTPYMDEKQAEAHLKNAFGIDLPASIKFQESLGESVTVTPTGDKNENNYPIYRDEEGKLYYDLSFGKEERPDLHMVDETGEISGPVFDFKVVDDDNETTYDDARTDSRPIVQSVSKSVMSSDGEGFDGSYEDFQNASLEEIMGKAPMTFDEVVQAYRPLLGGNTSELDEFLSDEENHTVDSLFEWLAKARDKAFDFRDNTYNWGWWGPTMHFGFVVTDLDSADDMYSEGILFLNLHAGGDVRGNYYPAEAFKVESYADEAPWYNYSLTVDIETDKGGVTLEAEGNEAYYWRVIADNLPETLEDKSYTSDELEDVLNFEEESHDLWESREFKRVGKLTEDKYNYTIDLSSGDWDVKIDPAQNYGYFEYTGGTNEGPEIQGGLWFNELDLQDYDGVYKLPKAVVDILKGAGYTGEEVWEFKEATGYAIRTREGGGRNSNVWSDKNRPDPKPQYDPLTKIGSKDGYDFYLGETPCGDKVYRIVPEGSEAPTMGYRQPNRAEREIYKNFKAVVQFEESLLREYAQDDRPLSDLGLETFEDDDLMGIRDIETGNIVVPADYAWVDNVYHSGTMMVSVRHPNNDRGAVELYFEDEED